MEWVKLSAVPAYYHDGALLRAGEAAEVLFCRALAHCGSVESRGLVEKTVLPLLVPTRPQARADALAREGLWLDEGAHYRIRSWEKWQDQHDVAAEKRRKDRERQRDHRRKQREDSSQDVSRDLSADVSRDGHSDNRDGHNVDVDVEGEREKNKTSGKPAAPPRLDVEQICAAVVAAEVHKGSKKPTVTDAWRTQARLMLDSDGRDLADVLAVVEWTRDHAFWRANIRSVPKLREQFDQLRLQRESDRPRRHADRELAPDKEWLRYS